MTTQSNPQVWDPDSTYSINELINNRIKTNQQINLANFNALQFPQEGNFHYNNFKIEPKDFGKVLIDGKYNRAVEDFNYQKLYQNKKNYVYLFYLFFVLSNHIYIYFEKTLFGFNW